MASEREMSTPPIPSRSMAQFTFTFTFAYVIVYQMWCCQCVSSQLDTHIAEVIAGVTLSVNVFEF